MTVARPIDQAQRPADSLRHDPPPLRWWTPAVAFAVSAVVLSFLVIGFGTNNRPLDDPNQGFALLTVLIVLAVVVLLGMALSVRIVN